jgi:hypothetical protein
MNWDDVKNTARIENFNHYKPVDLPALIFGTFHIETYQIKDGHVICIDGLIKNHEQILCHADTLDYKPVGADGYAQHWTPELEKVSGRSSTYDRAFSESLSQALEGILPRNLLERNLTTSCVDGMDSMYRYSGINPYLRFVKYDNQKRLIPHYDGHYYFTNHIQTTMTCLIYLTTSQTGQTTFLDDNNSLIEKKNKTPIQGNEILSIQPIAGRILLFDQYLLHSTKNLVNEEKSLILTDLVMSAQP